MLTIGKIDIEKYQKVTEKTILTDEVIITNNRIEHIIERRGLYFYNEYKKYFSEIVFNPDYIFKDVRENTALVSKRINHNGNNINIVIKLVVEGENTNYKNSIITVIKENEKRFAQRLRNNSPFYRNIDNDE